MIPCGEDFQGSYGSGLLLMAIACSKFEGKAARSSSSVSGRITFKSTTAFAVQSDQERGLRHSFRNNAHAGRASSNLALIPHGS